ncbi:hypothetical protein JG687_00006894 [Phytophthora cactorum]|uniref:Uncharacterized protein n=1 Tax=Phytophthora cactorum TaxID=29920 RepID=A0A8T1ULB2_9STRA|nr:hypothetical protein JG687_00006894 [Phytophthora cactorum]
MKWFGDVEVTVENLSKSARNSMIVTTRTSVTITERTLSNVFPHLPNPNIGDSKATLASKLLGQRIIMRGSTCFEWDAATKRVTSVVVQSDMLTPILRLLGSLEAVSQVFDKRWFHRASSGYRQAAKLMTPLVRDQVISCPPLDSIKQMYAFEIAMMCGVFLLTRVPRYLCLSFGNSKDHDQGFPNYYL